MPASSSAQPPADKHICAEGTGALLSPYLVPTLFSPVCWAYLAALSRLNVFGLGTLPSLLLVLGLHGWLWPPFRGHKIPTRPCLLLASLQLPWPILGCPCGENRQLSLHSSLGLLTRGTYLLPGGGINEVLGSLMWRGIEFNPFSAGGFSERGGVYAGGAHL